VGAFDHCKPGENPLLSQVNSFGKLPLLENPFPVNRSCLAMVVGVGLTVLLLLSELALLVQLEKITKIKNGIKIDLIRLALLVF
jgi:hypothetical protein